MAAKTRRGVHNLPEAWRDRIRVGRIMERLEKCVNGEIEMTSDQIQAGKLLLSKLVPDLARTELTGKDGANIAIDTADVTQRVLREVPEDRLRALLETSKGTET